MKLPGCARPSRLVPALLALLLVPLVVPPAEAASLASPERIASMKARQRTLLEQGMKGKLARKLKRAHELKQFGVSPSAVVGQRVRREPSLEPRPERVQLMREAARRARAQAPLGANSVAVNVRVNDPAGDPYPEAGQCEVSVAALGSNILVAWNDGPGFGTPGGSQGYGYSTNNGATWTDGGAPPSSAAVGAWSSDPVVIVNEKTGDFYFCALSDPNPSTNAIGIVRGNFSGANFNWQTPVAVRSVPNLTEGLDKQWAAVDSASGNLYVSFTSFTSAGAHIMFTRSTNGGANWSAPVQLSDVFYNGYTQGSRVAVGPLPVAGTAPVYVAWYTVGIDTPAEDYLHIRKSTTQGGSFTATQVAERIYANWGSGSPGFNRGLGFTFPGMAVDRSTTATRGRVYLAWHECINFYEDNLGNTGTTFETEPNDAPASATPFTIGRELRGTIATNTEFDYFSFSGTAGQTVILYADSVSGSLDASFRLFCSDGVTGLGFSRTGPGTDPNAQGLIVFTLPFNGTYYLRMASATGSNTGSYWIQTGNYSPQLDRSRDTRDVFVKWSPDGVNWPAVNTTQVNADPVGFDDWLPEVGVAPNGNVYVSWFDFHDSPAAECGGRSHNYIARSTNGSTSWTGNSPVSDVMSDWSDTDSDIQPNQGDYNGLFVNGNGAYAAWSDGRDGNPNVYAATVSLNFTATSVALVAAHASPNRVELEWHAADGATAATVYRRLGDGPWTALAQIVGDGGGRLAYVDTDVTAGSRYGYRLGLTDAEGETFAGEVWVDVPAGELVRLAIAGARPNPTRGPLRVAFTLPDDRPATLELLDVSGRRVRAREVGGAAGSQLVDLGDGASLAAGVYVLRLTQGGQIASSRVTVVR